MFDTGSTDSYANHSKYKRPLVPYPVWIIKSELQLMTEI